MPLKLHNELPDRFWTHNSGQEHFMKHLGDLGDVRDMQDERGLVPSGKELENCMHNDGLVVLRHQLKDGASGDVVGYAIADRFTDPKVLDVKEVYVSTVMRRQGLGGFLLGRLITLGDWSYPASNMSIHRIPTVMRHADAEYLLPGDHVNITSPDGPDKAFDEGISRFKDGIASSQRSLILDIHGEAAECLLYKDGEVVVDLLEINPAHEGAPEVSAPHPVLTAVHLLNNR